MKQVSVAEILELPVQERIRLVELIWDSIAAVPEALEVTPDVKAELEARLKEFEANPEAGYSWEQVKSHVRDGTWRSALMKRSKGRRHHTTEAGRSNHDVISE